MKMRESAMKELLALAEATENAWDAARESGDEAMQDRADDATSAWDDAVADLYDHNYKDAIESLRLAESLARDAGDASCEQRAIAIVQAMARRENAIIVTPKFLVLDIDEEFRRITAADSAGNEHVFQVRPVALDTWGVDENDECDVDLRWRTAIVATLNALERCPTEVRSV